MARYDINGFHVTKENVFAALDSARGGAVAEGNVGGGTGMICNQFKGGIGTASRRLPTTSGGGTPGGPRQCHSCSPARGLPPRPPPWPRGPALASRPPC